MTIVQELARLFAPWQSLYSDTKAVSIAVPALHIVAMLIGGGMAVAADRMTLRMAGRREGEREWHLDELAAVHRPVLVALAVMFLTGVALFAADVKTYAVSPVFWVKLGLVTLLMLNGIVLARTEAKLRRVSVDASGTAALWKRMQRTSIASLTLWTTTALAGAVLVGM